jgi:hypothetical protein
MTTDASHNITTFARTKRAQKLDLQTQPGIHGPMGGGGEGSEEEGTVTGPGPAGRCANDPAETCLGHPWIRFRTSQTPLQKGSNQQNKSRTQRTSRTWEDSSRCRSGAAVTSPVQDTTDALLGAATLRLCNLRLQSLLRLRIKQSVAQTG